MAKTKTGGRKPAKQGLMRRQAEPPVQIDMSNPAMAFAQLAKDKTIDADRLEKLIHLQERIMDRNAKVAFNAAYTAMQDQLPVIKRNGTITNKDGSPRSRYSKLEDIQRAVKPVLKQHGFSVRHRTEWPVDKPGIIRIVGILAHIEGHSEESAFEAKADANDYRTEVQDQGSTVSYGRRYTTIDVLNIEQEGKDNDGQGYEEPKAGRKRAIDVPPAGHDNTRGQTISDAQRRRLFVLMKKGGRTQEQIKAWLAVAYNIDSTKKITRRDYEDICKAVESPNPLPAPREREPGEEG